MGYTTTFEGRINIEPPLNPEEINYLKKFAETRRMNRRNGPYFVEGTGFMGQGSDADIIDYNRPPAGQPSLWCQWVPTEDGTAIVWDEGEKFYSSPEWMQYIIDHFLRPSAHAGNVLSFLQCNHVLNGVVHAEGEEEGDVWDLVVTNNHVEVRELLADDGIIEGEFEEVVERKALPRA